MNASFHAILAATYAAVQPILAYQTAEGQNASHTTYSFSSANSIGTASSDRLVSVLVFWEGSSAHTVTSATIGGIAATIVTQKESSNSGIALIQALVPSGTTAAVVVTFSSAIEQRCGIAIFTLKNYQSVTPITSTNSNNSAETSEVVSVTVKAKGVAIVGITTNNNNSISWSQGTTQLDSAIGGGATRAGAATFLEGSADTLETFTATFASSPGNASLAAAYR